MKKTRILVIEDSTSIRASLVELLRIKDYEVEAARNGIIGLELVAEFQPDLIICDIMMPELDGYQVLEAVRKVPKHANTPFIFLSAKADNGDVRQGMILGADDYLTKPFKDTELFAAVEARLARHNHTQQEVFHRLDDLMHFMGNMNEDNP